MGNPPIGTNDHPFIGHLDGCDNDEKTGHAKDQDRTAIVSNLTVSNNFNDFTRHPSKVTSLGNANAVGFFGTFGKEGESYADGAEPTAKNLYLDNLTVKTNSSNTLVGMAAGYVNGTLDGIGIADSKINVGSSSSSYGGYTSNLSDYTTVGYAEEKYRVNAYEKKISTKASDLEFSQESEGGGGSSAGNGGSIDMNTMYTNLLTIYNNSTDVKTATAETITYDINGNIVDDDITSTSTYSNIKVSEQTYDYENESLTSASYSFRGTFNNGIYIYGKESGTVSSQTKAVTEIRPTKFYYKTIADSTSSNYLSVSNGSVANATTGTSNYWFFDGNSLSLETNGTTYYLCNSSGTLTVTTYETYATNWAYDEDGATYVSDDGYYLTYDSGWTLKRASYKVSGTYNNSTYYLTNSGTSLTITSSQSSAATWLLDSSNRLYTTINGSTYYLTYSSSSSGWSQSYSPTLSKSYDNALTYDTSGGTFSVSLSEWWSTTTYYLYITSSGVSLNTYSKTTFTLSPSDIYAGLVITDDPSTEKILDVTTEYTTSATYESNPTYFPISGESGVPDENNTGYIVSGAYDSNGYGDIRIAGYSLSSSNLSNFYSSSSGLGTVYTVNDSGSSITVDENNFDHYAETKEKFETILSNSSNYVYGLHFMSSTINVEHLIDTDYARIGDTEYINQGYQLPEDSVDFNLQKKGYVNFFAGTYYKGSSAGYNKSFFSLHEIERDGAKIKNIREIEEIYENPTARQSQSYVYKYSGNPSTYSVPFLHGTKNGVKYGLDGNPLTDDTPTTTKPDGYTKTVFKTSWIKGNENLKYYVPYYFEIPANAGEYALGSVEGYAGAYLDYLDIGANSQRTDVTKVTELKEISTYVYSYPKGVSFSFISDDTSVALPAIDAKNNASFSLGSSFTGDMSVSRTNATDSTTGETTSEISYTSSSSVVTEYKDRPVDIKGNGTAISEATGVITEKIEINSITKYAYSSFSYTETKTEYRKTTTTTYSSGTQSGSSTVSAVYTNDEEDSESEIPVDVSWDFTEKYTSKTHAYYLESTNVTISIAIDLEEDYDVDADTYYYKLGGYNISYSSDVDLDIELISLSDSTLTVKVIDSDGNKTILQLSTPVTFTKNA